MMMEIKDCGSTFNVDGNDTVKKKVFGGEGQC